MRSNKEIMKFEKYPEVLKQDVRKE